MTAWSEAATHITRIEIVEFPGTTEGSDSRHVGVGYQIRLGGRVVSDAGGLTLHGPAGDRKLPAGLVSAVAQLWAYAERQVAEHEQVTPT